jgi:hypothetical protein
VSSGIINFVGKRLHKSVPGGQGVRGNANIAKRDIKAMCNSGMPDYQQSGRPANR